MSDLDAANVVNAAQDGANDEEDLAAAYEALAEDRRNQETERTAVNAARSSEPQPGEDAASVADHAPDSNEPTTDGAAPPQVPRVEDVETEGQHCRRIKRQRSHPSRRLTCGCPVVASL
jgi:hypothetical protein